MLVLLTVRRCLSRWTSPTFSSNKERYPEPKDCQAGLNDNQDDVYEYNESGGSVFRPILFANAVFAGKFIIIDSLHKYGSIDVYRQMFRSRNLDHHIICCGTSLEGIMDYGSTSQTRRCRAEKHARDIRVHCEFSCVRGQHALTLPVAGLDESGERPIASTKSFL
jgi:hypothetical protein